MKEIKKIGILGGSFDPIHVGHLWTVLQALEEHGLDKIWLMPGGSAKFWGKRLSPAKTRLEICKIAAKDFDHPLIQVAAHQIIWRYTYTYEVVARLQKEYPEYEFYWILGTDWNIGQFKNATELKKHCKIIKMHRPGFGRLENTRIAFDLSSSTIRDRVRRHLTINGLVTPGVEEFIKRNSLYDR